VGKNTIKDAENPPNQGNEEFCQCEPGKETKFTTKGQIETCPTLLIAELRKFIHKYPGVSSIPDAAFIAVRNGLYQISTWTEYERVIRLAGGPTPLVLLTSAQRDWAEIDFRVLPGCPTRKLPYKLCEHSVSQIYGMANSLDLSNEEAIKAVLVAGLLSVPDYTHRLVYEEFLRFIAWQELRLAIRE
jgi:hypothetical protein